MSEKLQPCPFCGGDNIKLFYDERQNYHVECYGCKKTVSFHISHDSSWVKAVEIWNRHTELDTQDAKTESGKYLGFTVKEWCEKGIIVKEGLEKVLAERTIDRDQWKARAAELKFENTLLFGLSAEYNRLKARAEEQEKIAEQYQHAFESAQVLYEASKARAEALKRALRMYAIDCNTCVFLCDESIVCCNDDNDGWQFDEARFSVEEQL